MIVVCNPNNPTGAILTEPEMDGIVRSPRDPARGSSRTRSIRAPNAAESQPPLSGAVRPCHRHQRPFEGVRSSRAADRLDRRTARSHRQDVVVSRLHDHRAGNVERHARRVALSPEGRARCFGRTRGICRANFPLFRRWLEGHGDLFHMVDPRAGPSPTSATTLPPTQRNSWSACSTRGAFSWSRAIISAWTATCASVRPAGGLPPRGARPYPRSLRRDTHIRRERLNRRETMSQQVGR